MCLLPIRKTVAEVPSRHLKQSSSSDVTGSNSVSKLNSVPQMTKKTFTVSKHQHTVMSSLASLWKDSKLCDATIGNGNFKIMVSDSSSVDVCVCSFE